mgnify:CR=1 FL=1
MSKPTPNDRPEAQAPQAPQKVIRYDLDELVAGITQQNLHAEINFGQPVGLENCKFIDL